MTRASLKATTDSSLMSVESAGAHAPTRRVPGDDVEAGKSSRVVVAFRHAPVDAGNADGGRHWLLIEWPDGEEGVDPLHGRTPPQQPGFPVEACACGSRHERWRTAELCLLRFLREISGLINTIDAALPAVSITARPAVVHCWYAFMTSARAFAALTPFARIGRPRPQPRSGGMNATSTEIFITARNGDALFLVRCHFSMLALTTIPIRLRFHAQPSDSGSSADRMTGPAIAQRRGLRWQLESKSAQSRMREAGPLEKVRFVGLDGLKASIAIVVADGDGSAPETMATIPTDTSALLKRLKLPARGRRQTECGAATRRGPRSPGPQRALRERRASKACSYRSVAGSAHGGRSAKTDATR